MDPDAAYRQLLEALERSELDLAWAIADGLLGWCRQGGFLPAKLSGAKLRYEASLLNTRHPVAGVLLRLAFYDDAGNSPAA